MASQQGSAIQFRNAALAGELLMRGDNLNQIAQRDLGRYYTLIRNAATNLVPQFSEAEWALMFDLRASYPAEPMPPDLFWMSIADAVAGGEALRFGEVNGLADKVRALSPLDQAAVGDYIERWWVAKERNNG